MNKLQYWIELNRVKLFYKTENLRVRQPMFDHQIRSRRRPQFLTLSRTKICCRCYSLSCCYCCCCGRCCCCLANEGNHREELNRTVPRQEPQGTKQPDYEKVFFILTSFKIQMSSVLIDSCTKVYKRCIKCALWHAIYLAFRVM